MGSGYVASKIRAESQRRLLPGMAAARLQAIRANAPQTETVRPKLLDYVAGIAPYFDRFDYLAPYAAVLEGAIGGNLRVAFAAPPQHGKSELALRAFLYWAKYFPGKRHAYVTYNGTRTQEVAKLFQRLAEEAGFPVQGTLSVVELGNGTTVKFTSIDAGLTGYAVDGVCLIDDPIKGPGEARSAAVRRDCKEFWHAVARTRRHEGTSFIVMATRWHIDDLSGYLIKEGKFDYINLKAIAEPDNQDDVDAEGRVISDPNRRIAGESLWKRKPPAFFREEQTNRYWWSAMYQGKPIPIGGNVFAKEAAWYRALPEKGYRGAFGLDLAYSAKTHADWSICVEMLRVDNPDGDPKRPHFYVVDVQRKQVDAPSFALTLKARRAAHPYPMRWYAAGTEKGSADFLNRQGLKIEVLPPKGDKFIRAQPVAAAWNDGRIFLPDPEVYPNVQWVAPFLDVVQNFTGVNDDNDDDVDALAAGYDLLIAPKPPRGLGQNDLGMW